MKSPEQTACPAARRRSLRFSRRALRIARTGRVKFVTWNAPLLLPCATSMVCRAALLTLLSSACGTQAPPPAGSPATPAQTSAPVARTPERAPPADRIVSSPAQLDARLRAVYLARVTERTALGGTSEWCARPVRRTKGAGPVPAELCTPVADV